MLILAVNNMLCCKRFHEKRSRYRNHASAKIVVQPSLPKGAHEIIGDCTGRSAARPAADRPAPGPCPPVLDRNSIRGGITMRNIVLKTVMAAALFLGCGGCETEPSGPTTTPPPPTGAAAPTIGSFKASPARITSDQATTLTWLITGAKSVSINHGIGVVTGDSVSVNPGISTTYTLTATSAAGTSATAATTVTVTGGVAGVTLTWTPGSTVKLEQVIGDKDWAAAAKGTTLPTASLTANRYGVFGTDIGTSFEHKGKVLFLFGDTRSEDPNVNLGAVDPIGFSTTTDGDAPLVLDFFQDNSNRTLWVRPPGVQMAGNNVPNAGISLSDGLFLVVNAGADHSMADINANAFSLLVRFDESAKTFTTGRMVSSMPGGHFVYTALRALGVDVYMFGTGKYRGSDIYLSKTPASGFWTGTGTQYFAGRVNGQPTWTTSEASAVPIIQDNPLNGPAWPNNNPTVGNLSVAYSVNLGMWLMTYDGGRQSPATRGMYVTYAKDPWGPWAAPQLIFNSPRDPGYGVFIHNPNAVPGDGLTGPTIGNNDPTTTSGAAYAPCLIERFTRVNGNTLRIYWLMSTWNPYTVVKMRSDFTIGRP